MTLAGRLLLATPLIGTPQFERAVVIVLAHGEDGAFGIILNRPSEMTVADALGEWAPHVSDPDVVFVGGPVDRDSVCGFAHTTGDDGLDGPVFAGGLCMVDLTAPPAEDRPPISGLRLYAGSSGWAPGQLEDEIEEGAWWVVDGAPDDALTPHPETLWSTIVRRQGGQIAWFANCPLDPTAN